MHLSEIINGFFILRRRRLAETTQTNYRYAFQRLTNYFGEGREFPTITTADIDGYLDSLRDDGLSDRSVHDNYAICSALWTFAAKEFDLPHVVSKAVKPAYKEKPIVPFTQKEIQSLMEAAEWMKVWNSRTGKSVRSRRFYWKRDLAVIAILLDTGLRVSELCALKINDYDKDTGQLIVRKGKGNKQRRVYLADTAQGILWRYLMSRKNVKPSDPLLTTRKRKPLHRSNVLNMLSRFGDNTGVKDVHPHRFRHTFAVQFLRNGGNIFELQRILGHEDLETVQIYINLADVDIERAQKNNSPVDNWGL